MRKNLHDFQWTTSDYKKKPVNIVMNVYVLYVCICYQQNNMYDCDVYILRNGKYGLGMCGCFPWKP